MHPELFKIPLFGGIPVFSYGALVALAFVVGLLWIGYDCRKRNLEAGRATDLAFYLILLGVATSRLMYVLIEERARFFANPLTFFRIWEGGLVFYGGLIPAMFFAIWYMRRYRMRVLTYVDAFTPAVSIAHAIGRLGCFMAGCCYGREIGHNAWYALTFPAQARSFAPPGIPLYPTQLMESFGELLIFTSLLLVRRVKKFEGQLLATYLILYGILRLVTESLRGDAERGYVLPDVLSISAFISILMVASGVIWYVLGWRRATIH